MLSNFINRFRTALDVLFIDRVVVLEITPDPINGRDKLALWGSWDQDYMMVDHLRKMADSIERDLHERDLIPLHPNEN